MIYCTTSKHAYHISFLVGVQKYNVGHFFVKILAKNDAARRFFSKHGFSQEGEVDAFQEVKMALKADQLPRTQLEIIRSI